MSSKDLSLAEKADREYKALTTAVTVADVVRVAYMLLLMYGIHRIIGLHDWDLIDRIISLPLPFGLYVYYGLNSASGSIDSTVYAFGFVKLRDFYRYHRHLLDDKSSPSVPQPHIIGDRTFYWLLDPKDLPFVLADLKKWVILNTVFLAFPVIITLYGFYHYFMIDIVKGWGMLFVISNGIALSLLLPSERMLFYGSRLSWVVEKYRNGVGHNEYIREFDVMNNTYNTYYRRNDDGNNYTSNNNRNNYSNYHADEKKDTEDVKIPEEWKKEKEQRDEEKSRQQLLNEALQELDSLIGLNQVKTQVRKFLATMQAYKKKKAAGFPVEMHSLHMVFVGPPGTGKTTVARIMAKLLKALGFLSSGHLVETDRSGLVAGYIGQTALKTQEVINKAKGGVLFIDEAYALSEGSDNDFGKEAVATLIKAMEDYRNDLVIIFAGYRAEMEKFLDINPGLRSRVPYKFDFADYTPEEICQMVHHLLSKKRYNIDTEALEVIQYSVNEFKKPDGTVNGSGRFARNLVERIEEAQNVRVGFASLPDRELMRIKKADIIEAYKSIKEYSNI